MRSTKSRLVSSVFLTEAYYMHLYWFIQHGLAISVVIVVSLCVCACARVCVCVCVCVCERERERESVCVCVRERERVCVCVCGRARNILAIVAPMAFMSVDIVGPLCIYTLLPSFL